MSEVSTLATKRCVPGGTGFGPMFAAEIRKIRSASVRGSLQWRWHLDEVFVRINGETHYLWRAVDHEGEVLETFVTKRRDRKAALRFLKKAMKRYGNPLEIVTDRLPSYRAAMKKIGNEARQTTGRWLNNRAENSHQPFRRRERAMAKFRNAKSLQKFTSIHSSLHNHFNHERHLYSRQTFKLNRARCASAVASACGLKLVAFGFRRSLPLLSDNTLPVPLRSPCSKTVSTMTVSAIGR